jgi:hydroxymethylpyrimidine pyrophosphatase-like HAD family hydrolase
MIFYSDLDNTLIYSYKHDIGTEKICVEHYQGREISYMTEKSYALLKKTAAHMLFVPVTTRTVEQYERIDFGMGILPYALVCNGGVLLKDGKKDERWLAESKELAAPAREELLRGIRLLEQDRSRSMEIREIEEMFLFTKSAAPKLTVERLQRELQPQFTEIFQNGEKVYLVPKALNKGTAVVRFGKSIGEKINAEKKVIAAGDSLFDIPMLELADIAFFPKKLQAETIFSDELLSQIMELEENENNE